MADGLAFPERSPEIEFRDGKRLVPPHLEMLLRRIETHRMTYEQAIEAANRLLEADFINSRHADIVAAHFRELR